MRQIEYIAKFKFKDLKPPFKFLLFKEEPALGGKTVLTLASGSLYLKLDTSGLNNEGFTFNYNAVHLGLGKLVKIDDDALIEKVYFD